MLWLILLLLPLLLRVVEGLAPGPPRVVVDVEVLAETLPLESAVTLESLQTLLPDGPWSSVDELPRHRYRTFDLARTFERVMCESKTYRAAEMVAILRLLFEERAASERSETAGPTVTATRPLTAGEVVENLDIILPRCTREWERSGFSFEDIDKAVAQRGKNYDEGLEGLQWRSDVLSALKDAAAKGFIDDEITVLTREGGLLQTALRQSTFETAPYLKTDMALATYASASHVVDLLDDLKAGRVFYLAASPSLALQVASCMMGTPQVHTFHCTWSRRWGGLKERPIDPNNDLGVAVLGANLRDFRRFIGLPA